ncbi:unnamed protein product [Orchesella dallaii]|uniref:Uncharacterized protein n=1 Tax=Orchesella dallaii TaxID=48710 RepID=A0ABP1QVW6_9HEXA
MGQMHISRTLLILGIVVLGEWSRMVQSVTTEQDLTLTAKEKRALDQNLKWRKENNMDTILTEDFSELERDYPFQIDYQDKEGSTFVCIKLSNE